MSEMISIEFNHQHQVYHALIRCTSIDGLLQVRVTVMNGDIEPMLSGHHIFVLDGGQLIPVRECQQANTREIQQKIMATLECSSDFAALYGQYFTETHSGEG
ncbi:MAG: hypothetical protein EOO05_14100 [Chitinophagaceae bacterium]|nr:MAG: hypothetical protein EOO05_14100 [Chitinophagaceae bacterium]